MKEHYHRNGLHYVCHRLREVYIHNNANLAKRNNPNRVLRFALVFWQPLTGLESMHNTSSPLSMATADILAYIFGKSRRQLAPGVKLPAVDKVCGKSFLLSL